MQSKATIKKYEKIDSYPELVVIGFVNIDLNITPKYCTKLIGGAGYFVSIAALSARASVGLVTRIGNDFPSNSSLSLMRSEGFKLDSSKPTSKSIQTYFSSTDFSQREVALLEGASQALSPDDIPENWISQAKHIHLATMPPKQQCLFMNHLLQMPHTATISSDTDASFLANQKQKNQIEEIIASTNLFFVNKLEYQQLKTVIDAHPLAIIKLDQEGAIVSSFGNSILHVTAPQVEAIDATGAGDLLAGTFISEWISHRDLTRALSKAVKIASNSVTKIGFDVSQAGQ